MIKRTVAESAVLTEWLGWCHTLFHMVVKTGAGRTRDLKSAERRNQLAESALRTLGELGYARTSLRDIAANSEFSHGVVHYYFADKTELITYCVRYYKAQCVTRYDEIIHSATSAEEVLTRFADKLCETLTEDFAMHRLWYDLRTQAMFEDVLRPDVLMIDATLEDMIWRVLRRYADLSGRALLVDSPTAYAMLDGVFEQALLRHLAGQDDAVDALRARALELVPHLLQEPVGVLP
ncbi:MAG: TetR/AcrR family transcriptional regulator [Tetrasphaera sp.]